MERIQLLGALKGSFKLAQKNSVVSAPPQRSHFTAMSAVCALELCLPVNVRFAIHQRLTGDEAVPAAVAARRTRGSSPWPREAAAIARLEKSHQESE
jgi:hypothetical protein